MSKLFKILLIISLFLPLWICVCIVYVFSLIDNYNTIENYMINVQDWICIIGILSMFVISLSSFIWCITKVEKIAKRRYNPSTFSVFEIIKKENYTTDFLATFILPFFAFYTGLSGTYTQVGVFVVCIVYLSVISIVYFKNKMLFTNVMFELFGYSFYEIKTDRGIILILSKKELCSSEDNKIKVNLISNEIATLN